MKKLDRSEMKKILAGVAAAECCTYIWSDNGLQEDCGRTPYDAKSVVAIVNSLGYGDLAWASCNGTVIAGNIIPVNPYSTVS